MADRPFIETEFFARKFVAACRAYGGAHHLTERIALQLLALNRLAVRQNKTPYLTHCKLAEMRGVQHRNTSRQVLAMLIQAGLILVSPNDDSDPIAYRQSIASGDVRAPGYNPQKHITSFRINFAAVARFKYRPTVAASAHDAAAAAALLDADADAARKAREARRDAAAIRRQLDAAGAHAASQARVEARRRGESDSTVEGRKTIEAAAAIAYRSAVADLARQLGVDPARLP